MAEKMFTFHHFSEKTALFRQGDLVTHIDFLLRGIGRYYYVTPDGKEWNKSLVKSGGAFASLICFKNAEPAPFSTETITDCLTARISFQDMHALTQQSDQWMRFLLSLYEMLILKKEKREAEFLLFSAEQRYQAFLDDFGSNAAQIPLRHIAQYIGVTDVSLSRIRRQIK